MRMAFILNYILCNTYILVDNFINNIDAILLFNLILFLFKV